VGHRAGDLRDRRPRLTSRAPFVAPAVAGSPLEPVQRTRRVRPLAEPWLPAARIGEPGSDRRVVVRARLRASQTREMGSAGSRLGLSPHRSPSPATTTPSTDTRDGGQRRLATTLRDLRAFPAAAPTWCIGQRRKNHPAKTVTSQDGGHYLRKRNLVEAAETSERDQSHAGRNPRAPQRARHRRFPFPSHQGRAPRPGCSHQELPSVSLSAARLSIPDAASRRAGTCTFHRWHA
jgi:hypothetical protein